MKEREKGMREGEIMKERERERKMHRETRKTLSKGKREKEGMAFLMIVIYG